MKVNVLELIANGLEVFILKKLLTWIKDSEPVIEEIGEGEHGQNAHSIHDNELFDELIEQNPNAEADRRLIFRATG